jgi:ribose 5-phosphate isomerase A
MAVGSDRDAWKRAAAAAAVEQVRDGMVIGLGTGSTAAFVVELLAARVQAGLSIAAIPTSERTAALARAGRIELTGFAEHPRIDLTVDGADQVERGTLNLVKGLGGALLREKIVADASERLLIVADASKLVDRLTLPVPVEAVRFGLEATERKIARLGAVVQPRIDANGVPYVTDGGNSILDCDFGPIGDPTGLESRLRALVGVIETGLFVDRADEVLVAGSEGVRSWRRAERSCATKASGGGGTMEPAVVVIMGVSGSGKTTIGRALAERLGWPYKEGDELHPPANVEKMSRGVPLTDEDRWPWLRRVAEWIDNQLAAGQPGIITCSLLKRSYRDLVIDARKGVKLLYLRGHRTVIAERIAQRKDHFMPPSLLDSQFETLEEPGPEEHPIIVEVHGEVHETVNCALRLLEQALQPGATD